MKPKINFLFAEQTFGSHMFVCTLTLPSQNPDADLSENRTGFGLQNLPNVLRWLSPAWNLFCEEREDVSFISTCIWWNACGVPLLFLYPSFADPNFIYSRSSSLLKKEKRKKRKINGTYWLTWKKRSIVLRAVFSEQLLILNVYEVCRTKDLATLWQNEVQCEKCDNHRLLIKFSSLSAPTKIEELTAGSEEKS